MAEVSDRPALAIQEEITLPVIRRANLGNRAVKVIQESTKTNPYTVIVMDDGRIGWVLPENIW